MENIDGVGTFVASLNVPTRLCEYQSNQELGKKVAPFVRLPAPHCNYSQGSEPDEKKQVAKKIRHHQVQLARSSVGNSGQTAKETDSRRKIHSADAHGDMDTDTIVEIGDGTYQSGKEVPRCGCDNLDSNPDYGLRENLQGISRHICKYCTKEFSSGRALGGHMRAHGSLSVEEGPSWIMNPRCKEKQHAGGSGPYFSTNTDSASDHTWSSMRLEGSPPYSKRSRKNGKEIQSMRSGVRLSKNDFKQESIFKISDETDPAKLEEDNVGAPVTEPEPSISSDDDGNNEETNEERITDGTVYNVCNVCDREFENGKQLSFHKKSHGLYALRRNPKRSRRFIDQDYSAEVTAASVPAKKTSSVFSPDGNMHACTECGKRFQSWKALFGHMRCHPERNWRGIHRPDVAKDKQDVTSCVESQLTSSFRKEALVVNDVSQGFDFESDAEGRSEAEPTSRSKAAASDNESDTESIEAAYMNGDRQPSTSTGWIWMTGKRSKRSRQAIRSMHVTTKTGGAPITPAENEMEHETAMGLMMLARKGGGKNWLEEQRGEPPKKEPHHNSSSERQGNELDEHQATEFDRDLDGEELASALEIVNNNKGKAKVEATDTASFCEENEAEDNDCEAGDKVAVSAKLKYVCNTCKRVFKSHQALGGHRASHKKVKGCFARTNVNDGPRENPNEEMTSEEYQRAEEELLTEFQDLSQSEGDEKEKLFSKEDSGEIVNGYRTKSKGHVCTICGRIFNSGQALGGHKRCHYNTKDGTSSEATSSTNNTIKQPAHHQCREPKTFKDEFVQQGGPTRIEEGAQMHLGRCVSEELLHSSSLVRQVKEKFLDLNLPAPVNDEDMEPETYGIAPSELICAPQPTTRELKGSVDFSLGIDKVKSPNFDTGVETGKQEYFPHYHSGKYASRVEENDPDLGGGQDTDFRGGEVDFSLRYVLCNVCDRQFKTVEALGNHEKTHASMLSSMSGLTPISA